MTDNEIIKALDICGHLEACADCPLGCLEGVDKCMHTLLLNALDLINRQKEDIDELEAIVDLRSKRKYYQKFVTEVYQKEKGNELSAPDFDYIYELYFKQKAEIERLKKTIKSYEKTRRAYQRYVRGNGWEYLWDVAIKEFAERLKNELELEDAETWFEIYECGLIREIDNLVKEMTEEQK